MFICFVAVLLKGGVNNVKSSSLTLRFSKLNAKYGSIQNQCNSLNIFLECFLKTNSNNNSQFDRGFQISIFQKILKIKQSGRRKVRENGEDCKIRRYIIFLLLRNYYIDQIKYRRLGGVYNTLARYKKCTIILVEIPKGRGKWSFIFFAEFLAKNLHNFIFVSVLEHGRHISKLPE